LVRPEGPVNVGMVARVLANVGGASLRLVQPVCDPLCLDARMYAHHAWPLLQQASCHASVSEAVADCAWVVGATARVRHIGLPFVDVHTIAPKAQERGVETLALVFGNERNGLSTEELQACDASVQLYADDAYTSYNLSHAVAIVLYAVRTALNTSEVSIKKTCLSATHEEVQGLLHQWLDVLDRYGYFRRTNRERFAPKLKAMLSRMHLSKPDVLTLRGMMSHWGRQKEFPKAPFTE
jgi:TrmH family RNA methyltransferase